MLVFQIIVALLLATTSLAKKSLRRTEAEANIILATLNDQLDRSNSQLLKADWAYLTDLSAENDQNIAQINAHHTALLKSVEQQLKKYDFQNFKNESLKRQIKFLTQNAGKGLGKKETRKYNNATNVMENNFIMSKVCSYEDKTKCDVSLLPDVEDVFANSRNPEELAHYWVQWYDRAGTPSRDAFKTYVKLSNTKARLNGFANVAEKWLSSYEDDTFEEQLENIMNQISPFYQQLHAFVRHRLREVYGDEVVSEKGPIPMHLLGNMWAETWDNIASIILPYPNKVSLDIGSELKEQKYTARKMFEAGGDFFQSLGLPKLPQKFWENSVIEKPKDKEVVCHPRAANFYIGDDVGILMCTRLSTEHFITLHHELGHVHYYMQYNHLPYAFKNGANDGFQEAIGDTIALSAATPKHLQKVGLLKNFAPDHENRINVLFRRALEKIVPLPFVYSMEKYRWSLFRGEIKPKKYNCAFWKLRNKFSGIEPPVVRSERDFDPTAKFHVAIDAQLISYFVSFIIQFQFHKALCEKAGQYIPGDPENPLDDCDIYGSHEAGDAFKAMLKLGSSKPWPEAMEVLTGQRRMDAQALVEYFEPLRIWLGEENKRTGAYVGWDKSDKCV